MFRIHVHIDTSPPNLTLAFAFVILKIINSEIILFRFAFISVSMVFCPNAIFYGDQGQGKIRELLRRFRKDLKNS